MPFAHTWNARSSLSKRFCAVSFADCYRDIDFTCVDCGSNETWLAEQQKWWYEEVGGYYFSTAIRCRSCRKKEKERKEEAKRVHLDGIKMKRGK
ncbi:MAG: zinc-ribbon domain containing protein [Desulfobacterales bacterium]|nr:zinc-ribbon domain containing protein [Desulfobacterales bacterium]